MKGETFHDRYSLWFIPGGPCDLNKLVYHDLLSEILHHTLHTVHSNLCVQLTTLTQR